eukprot:g10533.t1.1.5e17418b g10533  g10533.t1 contig4:2058920-2061102(+)
MATTSTTPSEQTPLVANGDHIHVADEENGMKSVSSDKPRKSKFTTQTSTDESSSSAGNSQTAFVYVAPYLRPRDRRHTILTFLALFTVLLEKLVNILPPLAIRHAVDAISDFASSSGVDKSSYSEAQHQTSRTIAYSILAYFLLQTFNSVLSSLQSISQRAVSMDAERRFASALFSHLHFLGVSYHLERHAGEMLRVLSRGSDATSTIIDSLLFNLVPTLFEACVVGTVFWKLLGIPSIAISTVSSVVLYLTYTLNVTNMRMSQRRKVLEKSDEVGRIETETLVNYETVAMFGRGNEEVETYGIVRKEYTEERVNMLGLFAWLQLGQQSIRLAGTCIGLWLAGRATVYGVGGNAADGTLSTGSFVVVQLYIQQLFQPLSYLGFTYRQITEAFTDLEKAVKCLRSVPSVMDADDAVEWDVALKQQQKSDGSTSGDIRFDNVSFRYKVKASRKKLGGPDVEEDPATSNGGGRRRGRGGRGGFGRKGLWGGRGRAVWSGQGGANFWIKDSKKDSAFEHDKEEEKVEVGGIQNVSFHVPAGRTAALVGPSGSGKTTIVRLLLRMYDADNGSVMVDEINVKALMQQSLRSNIGVVAQDTVLFHASLRDNITYGKEDATEEEIWDAVRTSALEPLVKSLPNGLETLVGERGMKLSGGERQRVGLARCIIKKPKLVLLDEATSALGENVLLVPNCAICPLHIVSK